MAHLRYVLLAAGLLALSGCSGIAPVPGGTETVNATYYQSEVDFKSRVLMLQAGMGESQVLQILGLNRNDLRLLSRNEILAALYGANTMQVMDSVRERDETTAYMQSLYGFSLEYKDVSKKHGFVNPFRIRTEEQGFDYVVNLIFRNGMLLEKPDLAGGVVHDTSSSTVFDYLNPGTIVNRVP